MSPRLAWIRNGGNPSNEPNSGEVVGFVLCEALGDSLYDLLAEKSGLGDSGESYLIDEDGLFVSPARFDERALFSRTTKAGAYDDNTALSITNVLGDDGGAI